MRPRRVEVAGRVDGAGVADVEDRFVRREGQPVRLVERFADAVDRAGERIEAVDRVGQLRLRPEALEPAVARVREPDRPSDLTTMSFGELSGLPSNASTTVSSCPSAGSKRLICAGRDIVPCSQTSRRLDGSSVIPLATLASARTIEMRRDSRSRRLIATSGAPPLRCGTEVK